MCVFVFVALWLCLGAWQALGLRTYNERRGPNQVTMTYLQGTVHSMIKTMEDIHDMTDMSSRSTNLPRKSTVDETVQKLMDASGKSWTEA